MMGVDLLTGSAEPLRRDTHRGALPLPVPPGRPLST
jgi:hypothetical protein